MEKNTENTLIFKVATFNKKVGSDSTGSRNWISFFLIFIFVLSGTDFFAQSTKDNLVFHKIPVQELSNTTISSIHQDKTGYMWFGTGDGLDKYDGFQVKSYNPFASDIKRRIYNIKDIHEDETGIFWIPTWKGLSRYDPEKDEFKIYWDQRDKYETNGPNLLYDIFEDSNHQLWLGSHLSGLHLFDPRQDKFIKRIPYFPKDTTQGSILSHKKVVNISEGKDGSIWSLTGDNKLNKLNLGNDKIDFFNQPPFLKSYNREDGTYIIKSDQYGKFWIVDKERFYHWDPADDLYREYIYPSEIRSILENILRIHLDKTGNIWITTYGNGLIKWNHERKIVTKYLHSPRDDRSIPSDFTELIYEDRNGLIWMSTRSQGIFYFNPIPSSTKHYEYNKNYESPSSNQIISLSHASNDKIWVTTIQTTYVLDRFDPITGKFEHFESLNNLKGNRINTIYESPSEPGIIWVGYEGAGLDRWNMMTGHVQNFRYATNDSTGMSANEVLSIFEDSEGLLWFTSQWGLTTLDRNTMTFEKYLFNENDPKSLSHNNVWSINEDSKNNIWLGTEVGLNKFDRQSKNFTRYLNDKNDSLSLSHNRIISIFEDSHNNLWFGCANGINLMYENSETFSRFSNLTNLSKDKYWKKRDAGRIILEDNSQRLWIGTERGVSVLSQKDGMYSIKHIDMLDGEFLGSFRARNTGLKDKNGILYFGTNKGIFVLDPSKWNQDSLSVPLVFTDFKLTGKSVKVSHEGVEPLFNSIEETQNIDLTYENLIITFDFTMLDYEYQEMHQYAYLLEGLNEDWTNIGNARTVTFTNLDPGSYVLKVKGNVNGQWKSNQAIEFKIHPAWWQTKAFRIGSILLFLAGLYSSYKYRIYSIKKSNQSLEKEVEERTEELEDSLNKLKEAQNDLINKEKMAVLGSLVSGIAHEINNPLGAINASNENSKHSLRSLLNNYPKLFQRLNGTEQDLYFSMVSKLESQRKMFSTKEENDAKISLSKKLTNEGISNADDVAEVLVELGFVENIEEYYPLLKHKDQALITETIYQSGQLFFNNRNIKIAIDQSSRIVFALKSYSYDYKADARIPIDLWASIENVFILFHNRMKGKVKIEKEFQSNLGIEGNPTEISQVWINIIANALDAMNNEGNLKITIAKDQNSEFVSIKFTDSGEGISPENMESIYDPFFTTKASGKGTGLGLDIVKKILERHQGQVNVTSMKGETTFEVLLPHL
jgi:signal transduction histidine kinase/ligand-binding sensor domain-containing protein